MNRKLLSFLILSFPLAFLQAQTIWNGPLTTFSKAALANPALPANQDRITASTWITRGNTRGLYNAFSEVGYVDDVSPANTEWATGALANYATLTYQPWEAWAGGPSSVPTIVGRQAVLHLISENIYIGIRFTGWGVGVGGGGSFAYERTTANVPTPVTLVGFTAAKKGNAVQLIWKTASEENTRSFTVERSANGREFSPMGDLAAAGFSSAEKEYTFTDPLPFVTNFYRLRINDRDGRTGYSGVVAFKTGKRPALDIFPVPVKNSLHVQSSNATQTILQLLDPAGRVVKTVSLPAGDHSLTLDASGLRPGLYFLRTNTESRTFLKE